MAEYEIGGIMHANIREKVGHLEKDLKEDYAHVLLVDCGTEEGILRMLYKIKVREEGNNCVIDGIVKRLGAVDEVYMDKDARYFLHNRAEIDSISHIVDYLKKSHPDKRITGTIIGKNSDHFCDVAEFKIYETKITKEIIEHNWKPFWEG